MVMAEILPNIPGLFHGDACGPASGWPDELQSRRLGLGYLTIAGGSRTAVRREHRQCTNLVYYTAFGLLPCNMDHTKNVYVAICGNGSDICLGVDAAAWL